jgi:hypothetical protein
MTAPTRYLVSMVGMLAVAAAYVAFQGGPPQPGPRLERPAPGVRVARQPGAPPPRILTAREILDRRSELAVAPAQIARLETLDRQWKERNRDLDAALEAAQQEVSRYMQAQAAGRTSLAELERRSADFRELSAELRERRRLHAEAAMEVLTEPQRRHVLPATSPETLGEGR